MCGRFSLNVTAEELTRLFRIDGPPTLPRRFNIAPTQQVAAVRRVAAGAGASFVMLTWGLVPSWAKDPAIGNKMINARAETAAEKPSFRAAFARRRCLILADGFYEWNRKGPVSRPFFMHIKSAPAFGMAGLWESWRAPSGDVRETCTILTTDANELVAEVHDRMPVILPPELHARWLDPENSHAAELQQMLRPYPAADMAIREVGRKVNSPKFDGPECLEAPAAS